MAKGVFISLYLVWGTLCACAQPPAAIKGAIETEQGIIDFELYPDRAPLSVANFVEHARKGLFDETSFYRVTVQARFGETECCFSVVQGGRLGNEMSGTREIVVEAFSNTLRPPIEHEGTKSSGLTHKRGALSMARLALGSASSEFFIVTQDSTILDQGVAKMGDGFGYAVFGQVTSGLDILDALSTAPRLKHDGLFDGQILDTPITIKRVTIE